MNEQINPINPVNKKWSSGEIGLVIFILILESISFWLNYYRTGNACRNDFGCWSMNYLLFSIPLAVISIVLSCYIIKKSLLFSCLLIILAILSLLGIFLQKNML